MGRWHGVLRYASSRLDLAAPGTPPLQVSMLTDRLAGHAAEFPASGLHLLSGHLAGVAPPPQWVRPQGPDGAPPRPAVGVEILPLLACVHPRWPREPPQQRVVAQAELGRSAPTGLPGASSPTSGGRFPSSRCPLLGCAGDRFALVGLSKASRSQPFSSSGCACG